MDPPLNRRASLAILALSSVACSAVSSLVGDVTGSTQEKEEEEKVAEIQVKVMRYADDYATKIVQAAAQVQADTPEKKLEVLRWQLAEATAAYEVATGANPIVNAVDMVVLASLTRSSVETYWVPQVFGESGKPLLATCIAAENDAWKAISLLLQPSPDAELRSAIDDWRAANPQVHDVSAIRLVNVAKAASGGGAEGLGSPTSVLATVGLDPFGKLEPAVQQVERTRVLAERALYYAKRWPFLLDLQAQLLALQLSLQPESQRALADVSRISRSAESFGRVADELPGIIDREREAAVRQFLDAVEAQEGRTRLLLAEMKSTLDAGSSAATSANGAIRSLGTLVATLNQPSPPGAPPSKPFDVNDYTRALAELAKAANDVHALIASIDRDAPQLEAVLRRATRTASEDGRELVDYAFRRGTVLIAILLVGLLAVSLVYRWASVRLSAKAAAARRED